MIDDSKWYADTEQLIDEVRDTRTHWGHLPDIRGYDRLVELRRGGQGVVYKARQQSTGRTVAIKVLLDGRFASDDRRLRFQRESDLVASLRHPNIVRVHDSGMTADQNPYYVMEYVQGMPLDQFAATRAPSLEHTLRLFLCICDAVQHAHQRGIIHRDLKPSNVLIDENGAPQIVDFGLARITASEARRTRAGTSLSHSGQILGSLPWASPEQLEGAPDTVDTRSDVYSIGVMLYQLLTGRLPHPVAGSLRRVLEEISTDRPAPPRAINRQIPDDVETIVLSCLAKEPNRRYQTVGELAADIRRYLSAEPIDAKREQRWYVLRKMLARHRAVAGLAAALLLALLAFAVTMTFMYDRAVTAEQNTQREAATAQTLNDFLLSMLESADPDHAPSRDITLREVLDLAAGEIQSDDTLAPEVAAEIHRTIGRTYLQLGVYDSAEKHLRESLHLRTQVFGEQSTMSAAAMHNLAAVFIKNSRHDAAKELLDSALAIHRTQLGASNDPQVHNSLAACLTSLGQIHHLRGEFEPAESLYREARAYMNANTLREIRDRLSITLALAGVLRDQGRLDEAEVLFDEALASARTAWPDAHPQIATILNNLGQLYVRQEKLAQADAAHREALRIYRVMLDPDHPRLATTLSNLAQLAAARGDYATAEQMHREVLDIYRARLGEDHEFVATTRHNIASCKMRQQDYAGAITEFQAALEGYRSALGETHPNIGVILESLARSHQAAGNISEAEQALRQALTIQTQALPENHPDTANTLATLGTLIMNHASPADAEPLLRRSVEMLRATLPANHSWLTLTEVRLGACLTRLSEYPEARELLERSVPVIEETLGNNDPRSIRARSDLCALYEATGQSDQLEACRSKLSP